MKLISCKAGHANMMTSSNGPFPVLLAICAWNSPVTSEFPTQRPVTRSFDVFFDLLLNKRLNKQWWGWWFGTHLRPLWYHCNKCQSKQIFHTIQALFALDSFIHPKMSYRLFPEIEKMSAFCWNFHHGLHQKLFRWFAEQPVTFFCQNNIFIAVFSMKSYQL